MSKVLFCAHPFIFDRDCQVVSIPKGADSLRKSAASWKQANGFADVYVYDMDGRFIWNF